MKIADNIRSVLIIDNKEEEVSGLKQVLDTEGTYYTFYTPEEINNINKNVKNHQIIFMDFSLDDTRTNPANISLIRKILKEHYKKAGQRCKDVAQLSSRLVDELCQIYRIL